MTTPTWNLITIRHPSPKHMAQLHSLALVPQAWLAGDPDPMLNLAAHPSHKVPRLNIRPLTLAILHPPRLQRTIQPNHSFLRPAAHIVRNLARIYSHPAQKCQQQKIKKKKS